MYATQADMVQRFGEQELLQLTDAGRTGVIDSAIVSMALDDATAEVNSYLASVLTSPPVTIPAILVSNTCDIARYKLYAINGGETVQVKERYDSAIRWLRDVSAGRAKLGIVSDVMPATSGIAASTRTLQFDDTKETAFTAITTMNSPY